MSPVLVSTTKPVVLVVDDVAESRELIEGHLADLGYAVRPARDGLEALEWIAAEKLVMQRHSVEGERICLPLRSTTQYLPIIRHHLGEGDSPSRVEAPSER